MANVQDYINRRLGESTPKQEVGIGGFTALVRTSERYSLSADAPITPVEDGSYVNDHVILKPLIISIEGDISDLTLRASPAVRKLQRLQAEIGNVASQYAPVRTAMQISLADSLANDAADAIRSLDNLIDTGDQIRDYFGNHDDESKGWREIFLDIMEAYRNAKQVISIDMPYRRCDNMIITSIVLSHDNEIDSTGFAIEAQQIEFADLLYIKTPKRSPGLKGQTDKPVSKGTQAGKPVKQSFFYQLRH